MPTTRQASLSHGSLGPTFSTNSCGLTLLSRDGDGGPQEQEPPLPERSQHVSTHTSLRQAMRMCPLLGGRESKLCLVPGATSNSHVLLEATGAWSCHCPSRHEATGISACRGNTRVLGIGSTAQLPSRQYEGCWLDSLDKHRACTPARSVGWAWPTSTGHQQQVSGVAAHPHSRTPGRGMPAG